MALQGTINGTTNNSTIVCKIVWTAVQSLVENYSDVTATLYYSRTNSGYTTSGRWSGSITINGVTTAYSTSKEIFITQNSNTQAMSATTRVYHGDNGVKSITISASGAMSATSLSSTSVSGTVDLDTIPRAGSLDSLTCSTTYLDGTFTYKYTPKSSSFYNRLRVSIPDVVKLVDINLGAKPASQQSSTYTLPTNVLESVYNRYPNASTCTIGFVIETYSDSNYSTKVGESAELKVESLNFPETVKPYIGGIFWEKFSSEPADWGLVQNLTHASFSMSGVSGAYGSSILSYSLSFAGHTSQAATLSVPNISESGRLTAVAIVTDSRSRTFKKEVQFDVTAYFKPKISYTIGRCSQNSSGEYVEDASGEYVRVTASVQIAQIFNNGATPMMFGYRLHESTSQETLKEFDSGETLIIPMSSNNTWDWTLYAYDHVSEVSINGSVSTGAVILDILYNGKGLSLGKVCEGEGFSAAEDWIAGTMVAQGVWGSWYWEKWSNGKSMCCTSKEFHNLETPIAYGSGFFKDLEDDALDAFPTDLFTSPPAVWTSLIGNGLRSAVVRHVLATQCFLRVYDLGQTTAGAIISVYALGRWK